MKKIYVNPTRQFRCGKCGLWFKTPCYTINDPKRPRKSTKTACLICDGEAYLEK